MVAYLFMFNCRAGTSMLTDLNLMNLSFFPLVLLDKIFLLFDFKQAYFSKYADKISRLSCIKVLLALSLYFTSLIDLTAIFSITAYRCTFV